MYVKVVGEQSVLIETTSAVQFGRVAVKLGKDATWRPSEGAAEGKALIDPDVNFYEAIGLEGMNMALSVLTLDADTRSVYEKTNGLLSVRYAWWQNEDELRGVVTTSPIFILGANGKTIDRV